MRPKKPVLYFAAGVLLLVSLWLFVRRQPQTVSRVATKPQAQNETTPKIERDLVFTGVEFPYSQVRRGENLTIACHYNNSLDFNPLVRAEVVVLEQTDKVKAIIYKKDIGAINHGLGTLTLDFFVPKTISPGEYKAILDVYLMPGDKLKGGCGTSRFSII